MLSVLAQLSIIRYMDFGLACFNTLKDLMNSGREMAEVITDVLKVEVITRMRGEDLQSIPVSIIKGLHELVEDTKNAEVLEDLLDTAFPKWLRQYCEKLKTLHK